MTLYLQNKITNYKLYNNIQSMWWCLAYFSCIQTNGNKKKRETKHTRTKWNKNEEKQNEIFCPGNLSIVYLSPFWIWRDVQLNTSLPDDRILSKYNYSNRNEREREKKTVPKKKTTEQIHRRGRNRNNKWQQHCALWIAKEKYGMCFHQRSKSGWFVMKCVV